MPAGLRDFYGQCEWEEEDKSSGTKKFAVRRCPATLRSSVYKRDLSVELKKLVGALDFQKGFRTVQLRADNFAINMNFKRCFSVH